LLSTAIAKAFVSQYGVVVRDKIPIAVREWNEPSKLEDGVSIAHIRSKKGLWESLMSHFTLLVLETEAPT
jgi:hypothetical protein